MPRPLFITIFRIGIGGKTAAVASQCSLFLELGYLPTIATFGFDHAFDSRVAALRRAGLPDEVTVVNAFDDLRRRQTRDASACWSRERDDATDGLLVQEDPGDGTQPARRYFTPNGDYVKHRRWNSAGRVLRTTYFEARRPTIRHEYEEAGYCDREYRYDRMTGEINEERYYTPDGFCYLSRLLDVETGKLQAVHCNDRDGMRSVRHPSDVSWNVDWFSGLLEQCPEKPLVVAESPGSVTRLRRIPAGAADRLAVLHESHYAAPNRPGSPLREADALGFADFGRIPAVAVLTARQAELLNSEMGGADNVTVVRSEIADPRSGAPVEKVPGRIGVFSRLVADKRIDLLIRMLPRVRAAVPDAHLEIFGEGGDRARLEKLAREEKVADAVHFRGRITGVGDEMARCIVTASTSVREGLGLAIGESLAAETPVVAFDICFGPRELIADGTTGYLVRDGNSAAFAKALIKVLKNPAKAARMGRLGAERMQQDFSRAAALESWRRAFDLVERREARVR